VTDTGTARVVGAAVGLVVLVAVALGMVLVVVSASNRTSWTDLEIGTCIDLSASLGVGSVESDDELFVVDTIPCDGALAEGQVLAEVVGLGDLNAAGDTPYPPSTELLEIVDRRCALLAVDDERFGRLPIVPDERTWTDRDGRYVCLAVAYGT